MTAADHASGARTGPEDEEDADGPIVPVVCVHLTPFVRGLAWVDINDPARWPTALGRTAASVLRTLLRRVGATPAQVVVVRSVNGDVEILGPYGRDIDPFLSSEPAPGHPGLAPLAFIHHGLSADAVEAALARLHAARWAPADLVQPLTLTGAAA